MTDLLVFEGMGLLVPACRYGQLDADVRRLDERVVNSAVGGDRQQRGVALWRHAFWDVHRDADVADARWPTGHLEPGGDCQSVGGQIVPVQVTVRVERDARCEARHEQLSGGWGGVLTAVFGGLVDS